MLATAAAIENRPLARALYEKTAVDYEIPYEFYREVAQVLNFVYELQNKTPPKPKRTSGGAAVSV